MSAPSKGWKKEDASLARSLPLLGAGYLAYDAFWGTQYDPLAWAGAAAMLAGGAKALAAASKRSHEIFTLLKSSREETAHAGTARWGGLPDLRRNGHLKSKGMFLGIFDGRDIWDAKSVHGIWFAPPGGGKTTTAVTTNIALSACSGEYDLIIYNDPKPEIGPVLAPFFKSRGIQFYPINPSQRWSEYMGESAHFNACDFVISSAQSSPQTLLADCRSLSLQLIKAPKNDASDKNKWWKDGARETLSVLKADKALTDPENCNYPSIQRFITDPVLLESTLEDIARKEQLLDGDLAASARDLIALSVQDPKNFGSMRSEAAMALKMFTSSGAIAQISRTSSFHLDQASFKKPIVIGLTSDITCIEEQMQFAGLNLISLIKMSVRRARPLRIKVIWDEANVAPLEGLNETLNVARGLGCSFELFYQSSADAWRVLGKENFAAVLANCDRKTWFAIHDPDVAEEVSKALGEITALKESYSQYGDEETRTTLSHERRRMATASELRELPEGLMITLIGSEKPQLIEKISYAQIDPLKRKFGGNPWHGGKKYKRRTRVRMQL